MTHLESLNKQIDEKAHIFNIPPKKIDINNPSFMLPNNKMISLSRRAGLYTIIKYIKMSIFPKYFNEKIS
jgi:hypothetical protein